MLEKDLENYEETIDLEEMLTWLYPNSSAEEIQNDVDAWLKE